MVLKWESHDSGYTLILTSLWQRGEMFMADIRSGTQRDISNRTDLESHSKKHAHIFNLKSLILKTIDSVFVCEKSWHLSIPTKFIVVTTKIV